MYNALLRGDAHFSYTSDYVYIIIYTFIFILEQSYFRGFVLSNRFLTVWNSLTLRVAYSK